MSEAATVVLEHPRFGHLEAEESALLHCEGLPGFPEARRLLLLEHDRSSPFAWLVCLEIPALSFVVTDPRNFWDYTPNPHRSDLRAIGAEPGDELDVLAIANLGDPGPTLNLAAPILVNPRSRRAVQAILSEDSHSICAPLAPLSPPPGEATTQIESKPQR